MRWCVREPPRPSRGQVLPQTQVVLLRVWCQSANCLCLSTESGWMMAAGRWRPCIECQHPTLQQRHTSSRTSVNNKCMLSAQAAPRKRLCDGGKAAAEHAMWPRPTYLRPETLNGKEHAGTVVGRRWRMRSGCATAAKRKLGRPCTAVRWRSMRLPAHCRHQSRATTCQARLNTVTREGYQNQFRCCSRS